MAKKFSDFTSEAAVATTELVGYKTGSTTNTRYSLTQVADGLKVHGGLIESFIVAASDETTALTTGTNKAVFRMPYAFTLTAVAASLTTAGTTSGLTTIDINEDTTAGGVTPVSILSTPITIDLTEKTSVTAATQPVISDTSLAADSQITVDIDAISGGATETGLKVTLIGYKTA